MNPSGGGSPMSYPCDNGGYSNESSYSYNYIQGYHQHSILPQSADASSYYNSDQRNPMLTPPSQPTLYGVEQFNCKTPHYQVGNFFQNLYGLIMKSYLTLIDVLRLIDFNITRNESMIIFLLST